MEAVVWGRARQTVVARKWEAGEVERGARWERDEVVGSGRVGKARWGWAWTRIPADGARPLRVKQSQNHSAGDVCMRALQRVRAS